MTSSTQNIPVIIRGVRTPFLDSAGDYSSLMAYELGAKALAGLVEYSQIDSAQIDMVAMGIVLHEVETSNVAREAMLAAGLASTTPAYTTSMAGLSPNIALTSICDMIALGRIQTGIAAGTENFSDVPIRLAPRVRRAAMKINQDKSLLNIFKQASTFRPADLMPAIPSGTDFTTKQSMGVCAEKMVKKFGVSREESDAFTERSHQLALNAWTKGFYQPDIVPVTVNHSTLVERDNSMRADASLSKLSQLQPVFDRKNGIVTAGNSSRYTDGAGAVLITSLQRANQQQQEPLAAVRDYAFSGVTDLATEMLLGPAMAIPKLLQRNGLTIDNIDVWEVHEAFAAQLLANQACLRSAQFAKNYLGLDRAIGEIPLEKLNTWGGSLALGNPFAATGIRLITTAARRLQQEKGRYAIVSSCAGGGLGAAIFLERI